ITAAPAGSTTSPLMVEYATSAWANPATIFAPAVNQRIPVTAAPVQFTTLPRRVAVDWTLAGATRMKSQTALTQTADSLRMNVWLNINHSRENFHPDPGSDHMKTSSSSSLRPVIEHNRLIITMLPRRR